MKFDWEHECRSFLVVPGHECWFPPPAFPWRFLRWHPVESRWGKRQSTWKMFPHSALEQTLIWLQIDCFFTWKELWRIVSEWLVPSLAGSRGSKWTSVWHSQVYTNFHKHFIWTCWYQWGRHSGAHVCLGFPCVIGFSVSCLRWGSSLDIVFNVISVLSAVLTFPWNQDSCILLPPQHLYLDI